MQLPVLFVLSRLNNDIDFITYNQWLKREFFEKTKQNKNKSSNAFQYIISRYFL